MTGVCWEIVYHILNTLQIEVDFFRPATHQIPKRAGACDTLASWKPIVHKQIEILELWVTFCSTPVVQKVTPPHPTPAFHLAKGV